MNYGKIKKITNSKFFIPLIVILINIIFLISFNLLFDIRYETIDDFMMMNMISKSDGSFNYYSIHIHPVLSYIIMILFKTGISINWYSIFLLFLQFISFTTIGTILIRRNKKIGTICYLLILNVIYARLLMYLQYTSVATVTILAGFIVLIYSIDSNRNKKIKIYGIILSAVGIMLRWKSIILVAPFYIIYIIFYTIKNKNTTAIRDLIKIIIITFIIVISNSLIYRSDPLYKKQTEFINIRTYFYDFNILNYEDNKETLEKLGWSKVDYDMLYSYALNDENFYTTEKLKMLKESTNFNETNYLKEIINSFRLLYLYISETYLLPFITTLILLLLSLLIKKNRKEIFSIFIMNILLNYVLIFSKPVFRVIISSYAVTITMMSYYLTAKKQKDDYILGKLEKNLITSIIILFILINGFEVIVSASKYNISKYSYIKEIIDYTKSHKENAYLYSTSLNDIFLSYSVFEKIEDDTFSNLRSMSDWDMYNKEYYEFKERYDIENIITDLYKKDNLYIITGNARTVNNTIYRNHIELIKKYIEQHYSNEIDYKVIKEFDYGINIYKLYLVNEGEK